MNPFALTLLSGLTLAMGLITLGLAIRHDLRGSWRTIRRFHRARRSGNPGPLMVPRTAAATAEAAARLTREPLRFEAV